MATQMRHAAALARFEARRVERKPVAVTRASVREHGQQPEDATLVELSIYGCRLAMAGAHEAGTRVWLRLDGGRPIAASVVWSKGGEIGCRFDESIANGIMRDLTRA